MTRSTLSPVRRLAATVALVVAPKPCDPKKLAVAQRNCVPAEAPRF